MRYKIEWIESDCNEECIEMIKEHIQYFFEEYGECGKVTVDKECQSADFEKGVSEELVKIFNNGHNFDTTPQNVVTLPIILKRLP